jgi:Right handed beta helix region
MTRSLVHRIGRRNLLVCIIVGCLVIASVVIGLSLDHGGTPASNDISTGNNQAGGNHGGNSGDAGPGRSVCGQKILQSPFNYDGAAGSYSSSRPGLPTYGTPGSDFPNDTAGVILPAGTHSYASYQLAPNTVYYLLPGVHIGSLQANKNDAFVGGLANGQPTVLSGDYTQVHWAIDSNSSVGNQTGVTIEYLTVKKYTPAGNSGAINPDSNTAWTIRYNMITLNVPGAGVVLGADNVLKDNCITLNGQYGFQSVAANTWGVDQMTGGPYNVTVEGNEISYNDTCDFEGLLDNPSIGWSKHNPVPPQYRNSHCGPVVPDGDQGGFKLWQTDGVTIKDNYIHNNWGPGGWADTDNANTTYTGNTITDNDAAAIIEEISYNFSITDNYLANNGWAGLGNPNFPSPAIYISESGSDRTFGGVPGCPETSCADQPAYSSQSVISGNTLVNNGGGVFLWQDSNRFCTDGFDNVCTLVRSGSATPFTTSGCKSNLRSASINKTSYVGNLTGSPRLDWWDGCLWKTENVSITHNVIDFNTADIPHCGKTDWPACGANGIFSEYGSAAPYDTPYTLTQLVFFQNNSWSANTYNGPSTFYVWNQGNGDNPVSWEAWTGSTSGGDKCSSPSEHQSGYCNGPFGQDAGSTYNPASSG